MPLAVKVRVLLVPGGGVESAQPGTVGHRREHCAASPPVYCRQASQPDTVVHFPADAEQAVLQPE